MINLVLLFVAFIAPCFPYCLWLVVPVYVVVCSFRMQNYLHNNYFHIPTTTAV